MKYCLGSGLELLSAPLVLAVWQDLKGLVWKPKAYGFNLSTRERFLYANNTV